MAERVETADMLVRVKGDAAQLFALFKQISDEWKKLKTQMNTGAGAKSPASNQPTNPQSTPQYRNAFAASIQNVVRQLLAEQKALAASRAATESVAGATSRVNAAYTRRENQINQYLRQINALSRMDAAGTADQYKLAQAVGSLTDRVRSANAQFQAQETQLRRTAQAAGILRDSLRTINFATISQQLIQIGDVFNSFGQRLFNFGKASLVTAGDIEALRFALNTLTKDAAETNRQFAILRQDAKRPGLGLEEGIRANVQLQSTRRVDFEGSRNIINAFSQLNAQSGGGKEQFGEAMNQITQAIGKGKLLSEDFKPLFTQLPALRALLEETFNTSDLELLREKGITPLEIFSKIADKVNASPAVQGGIKNSLENLGDELKILKATIGEGIAPLVLPFIAYLNDTALPMLASLAEQFKTLSPNVQIFLGALVAAIPSIGFILSLLGNLASVATVITGLFSAGGLLAGTTLTGIGAALGSILPPLLAIIAALAAFYLAYKNNLLGIADYTHRAIAAVVATYQKAFALIEKYWSDNGESIIEAIKRIWNFFAPIQQIIVDAVVAAVRIVYTLWEGNFLQMINVLSAFVKIFAQIINGDWAGAWKTFTDAIQTSQDLSAAMLEGIWNAIYEFYERTKAALFRATAWILEKLLDFLEALPGYIVRFINWQQSVLVSAGEWIINFFRNLPARLYAALLAIITWLVEAVKSIFAKLREMFSNPQEIAKLVLIFMNLGIVLGYNMVTSLIDEIKKGFPRIRQAIADLRTEAQSIENKYQTPPVTTTGDIIGGSDITTPPKSNIVTTPQEESSKQRKQIEDDAQKQRDFVIDLLKKSADNRVEALNNQIREKEILLDQAKAEEETNRISNDIKNLILERNKVQFAALKAQTDAMIQQGRLTFNLLALINKTVALETQGVDTSAIRAQISGGIQRLPLAKREQARGDIEAALQNVRAVAQVYIDSQKDLQDLTNRQQKQKEEIDNKRKTSQEKEAKEVVNRSKAMTEVEELFAKASIRAAEETTDRKIELWRKEAEEHKKTFIETEKLIAAEEEKTLRERLKTLAAERKRSMDEAIKQGKNVTYNEERIMSPTGERGEIIDYRVTSTDSKDVAEAQIAYDNAMRALNDFIAKRDGKLKEATEKDKARVRELAEGVKAAFDQMAEAQIAALEKQIERLKIEQEKDGEFFTRKRELRLLELQLEQERENQRSTQHLAELERKKAEIEADKGRFVELILINGLIEAEKRRHQETLKQIESDKAKAENGDTTQATINSIAGGGVDAGELDGLNTVFGGILNKINSIVSATNTKLAPAFKTFAGVAGASLRIVFGALQQVAQKFIETGQISLKELRKLIADELKMLGRKYLVMAIEQTAIGVAKLFYAPQEAAGHFASAALFGVAAAAAGVAGGLIGIGTGGGKGAAAQTGNQTANVDGTFTNAPSNQQNGETVKFNERLGELIEVLKNRDNSLELIVRTDEMQIVDIAARANRRNQGRLRLQNITGVYNYNIDG